MADAAIDLSPATAPATSNRFMVFTPLLFSTRSSSRCERAGKFTTLVPSRFGGPSGEERLRWVASGWLCIAVAFVCGVITELVR